MQSLHNALKISKTTAEAHNEIHWKKGINIEMEVDQKYRDLNLGMDESYKMDAQNGNNALYGI